MSLLPTPLRDLKVNPTEEGENYREPSADVGGAPGGGSGLTPGPRAGGSQPGWEKKCKKIATCGPGSPPQPCQMLNQEALFPSSCSWPCLLASPKGSSLRSRGQTTALSTFPSLGSLDPSVMTWQRCYFLPASDNKGNRQAGVSWEFLCWDNWWSNAKGGCRTRCSLAPMVHTFGWGGWNSARLSIL